MAVCRLVGRWENKECATKNPLNSGADPDKGADSGIITYISTYISTYINIVGIFPMRLYDTFRHLLEVVTYEGG